MNENPNEGGKTMDIKKADFAGSWYPESPRDCEMDIHSFMSETKIQPVPDREYRAGIVPHAGWYFSGALACQVIGHLKGQETPDAIVLFGKHMRPGDKATVMVQGCLETPLGPIAIHENLAAAYADAFGLRKERASSAGPENTIELQLPFIRYFFPDVPLVAMGVPPTGSAGIIGRKTVEIAGKMGLNIKVIGSTDLTHYGPNYGFTPHGHGQAGVRWVKEVNDPRMIEKMIAMDEEGIVKEALASYNACCGGAVAAAVSAAKALGAERGEMLAYTTSYDKNPGESLVGYVGLVF